MTATFDANNRQVGVSYDANGNPGTANGAWNGYSVENRLNTQTSMAWPEPLTTYGYDPNGKRVMKRYDPDPNNWSTGSSPTWEFYFYGITGQRLVTVDCVPSGGALPSCSVVGQNVYFGKELLVSNGVNVVTDRLGSVRGNTQGERFSYYPYGEERTSTVDGRDKFGTYFRDGVGQDYADQRYYSAGMGRYLSPDPSMNNVVYGNAATWNSYAYTNGDPINFNDPDGLTTCGDLQLEGGGTVAGDVNANTAQGHFIDLVWHEGGFLAQVGNNAFAWLAEFQGIAQAIWDRYLIVSGSVSVVGANGVVYAGQSASTLGYGFAGATADATLNNVLVAAANGTGVLDREGQLVDNANTLQAELNEDQGDMSQNGPGKLPLTNGSGQITGYVTQDCWGVIAALESANSVAAGDNLNPRGAFITSWNSSAPIYNPNYAAGIEYFFGNVGGATNFFGFTNFTGGQYGPVRRPPPSRKRRGRGPL